MRVLMIIALSILLLPNAVSAQSSRYSTWADPSANSAPNPALDNLVEELNKLIDKAEKAKTADPTFCRTCAILPTRTMHNHISCWSVIPLPMAITLITQHGRSSAVNTLLRAVGGCATVSSLQTSKRHPTPQGIVVKISQRHF